MEKEWSLKTKRRIAALFVAALLMATVSAVGQLSAAGLVYNLYGVEVIGNEYWVCGANGQILHSANGRNWVLQKSGVDVTLLSISFVNNKKGFCVGFGGTLLKTDDGGNRWVKVPVDTKYCITGIKFLSENRGIATGEFGKILVTDDGGSHWKLAPGKEMDFILQAIDAFDGKDVWLVGEFGKVLHSADAGRTWKNVDVGAEEYTLFGVRVIDKNRIAITSMDGLLFVTENGGKSWKKIVINDFQAQLFGVEPVSAGDIYVYGNGGLSKTTAAFRDFHMVDLGDSLTYGWIYRLRKNTAVGKNGSLYRLVDGKWSHETISY